MVTNTTICVDTVYSVNILVSDLQPFFKEFEHIMPKLPKHDWIFVLSVGILISVGRRVSIGIRR